MTGAVTEKGTNLELRQIQIKSNQIKSNIFLFKKMQNSTI